jgi:hypothetical protein
LNSAFAFGLGTSVTKFLILILFSMVLFPFVSLSSRKEQAPAQKPSVSHVEMMETYRALGLIENRSR